MSLYNDASLIVTPNAYKESKLYSIKPTDGSGDLDVVRATSATRVDENGLIESVDANIARLDYSNGSCPSILVEPQRTNLVRYSEEFNDSSWVKDNSSIIANDETSPNGTLTADIFIGNGVNNFHQIYQSGAVVTSGVIYTISIFAKKGTNDFIQLSGSNIAFSVNCFANFDLNNGTIGTVGSNSTASIVNYGNGWYRCIVNSTATATSTLAPILINLVNSSTAVKGQINNLSTSVFLWGAQLEQGSNATSYIPTTTASVTRNADVISKSGISGITTITETFEDNTTNVISGSPTSYTMSQGRIKQVIGE